MNNIRYRFVYGDPYWTELNGIKYVHFPYMKITWDTINKIDDDIAHAIAVEMGIIGQYEILIPRHCDAIWIIPQKINGKSNV